jgi:hypothetical protein
MSDMSTKQAALQNNREPHTSAIREAEYENPVDTRLNHERVLVQYFWESPLELLPSKLIRHFIHQVKNPEALYVNAAAYGGLAFLANTQGNFRLFITGAIVFSLLEHFFGDHIDEYEATYQQK